MHVPGIVIISLAHFSSVSFSQPIIPTLWGTYDCAAIPEFSLIDKNPASGLKYNSVYGVGTLEPLSPDVIIVGLYFADTEDSWANANKQDDLAKELIAEGYSVKSFGINYYAPLACVVEGECVNFWWNSPSFFPSYDNCEGYVAGCAPSDYRLQER